MRPVPTSTDRLAAAWDLWLVRVLTRFSLSLRPGTLVVAAILVCLGIALLSLAVLKAFGDRMAANVREVPGLFTDAPAGLTNATHFVLLCALPLMAGFVTSLAQVFGVSGQVGTHEERRIWQGLGLGVGDIVLTHEVVPRLPVLLVTWTPVIGLLALTELTHSERGLVLLLLFAAVAAEVMRLGVVAQRLAWVPVRSRAFLALLSGLGGAMLLGVLVGVLLPLAVPVARDAAVSPAVVIVSVWAVTQPLAVGSLIGACTALGGVLLARATWAGGGFRTRPVAAPAPAGGRGGRIVEVTFPVVGPAWFASAWGGPELRWVMGVLAAVLVASPDTSAIPSQALTIGLIAVLLGYGMVRLTTVGLAAGLMRLRHHVESGEAPLRLSVLLLATALGGYLPLSATVAALLVVTTDLPIASAAGVVLLAPVATCVADAVVARPGTSGLDDARLTVMALAQSAAVLGGWSLFVLHPAAGWLLTLILLGVHPWVTSLRLHTWRPRVRL